MLFPQGANLPSLTRALVACAWFGIQTWIGGSSIHQMLVAVTGNSLETGVIAGLGITAPQLGCFLAFWALQVELRRVGCTPAASAVACCAWSAVSSKDAYVVRSGAQLVSYQRDRKPVGLTAAPADL